MGEGQPPHPHAGHRGWGIASLSRQPEPLADQSGGAGCLGICPLGGQWAAPLDAQPCPPVAQLPAKPAQDDPADDRAAARLTIAQLEARLDERAALVRAAEARAEAAEADRDRWRALAEKLTDRPTAPAAPEPASASSPASVPSPRRWWPWRRG